MPNAPGPLRSLVPFLCAAPLAAPLPAPRAHAASLRVWGNAGYEQATLGEGLATETITVRGYGLGVLVGAGFLDTIPGFALLGGVGVRSSSLKGEKDEAELTLNGHFGAVELGVEVSIIPLVYLQAMAGYDRALGGSWKGKYQGTSMAGDKDGFERYDRFHLTGRILCTVFPFLALGLEPSYVFAGKVRTELSEPETSNLTGLAVRGVAALNF